MDHLNGESIERLNVYITNRSQELRRAETNGRYQQQLATHLEGLSTKAVSKSLRRADPKRKAAAVGAVIQTPAEKLAAVSTIIQTPAEKVAALRTMFTTPEELATAFNVPIEVARQLFAASPQG